MGPSALSPVLFASFPALLRGFIAPGAPSFTRLSAGSIFARSWDWTSPPLQSLPLASVCSPCPRVRRVITWLSTWAKYSPGRKWSPAIQRVMLASTVFAFLQILLLTRLFFGGLVRSLTLQKGTTNQMPVLSATPQTLRLAWWQLVLFLPERRFLSLTVSNIGRGPIPTLRPVFLSGSGTSRPSLSPVSPLLPPSPRHL